MTRLLAILVTVLAACSASRAQSTDHELLLQMTLLSAVPLADFSGSVVPSDLDPRFALTAKVEAAFPEDANLRAGTVITFAIHSPALLLEEEPIPGKAYNFALRWIVGDGGRTTRACLTLHSAWIDCSHCNAQVGGEEVLTTTSSLADHLPELPTSSLASVPLSRPPRRNSIARFFSSIGHKLGL